MAMFEQTFVDGVGKTNKGWTVVVSFGIQFLIVVVLSLSLPSRCALTSTRPRMMLSNASPILNSYSPFTKALMAFFSAGLKSAFSSFPKTVSR